MASCAIPVIDVWCFYIYRNIGILAVARPPDRIHPNVIKREIHIRPYGIERRPQNINQGDLKLNQI